MAMVTAGEVLVFFGCIGIILVLFKLNDLTATLRALRAEAAARDAEGEDD